MSDFVEYVLAIKHLTPTSGAFICGVYKDGKICDEEGLVFIGKGYDDIRKMTNEKGKEWLRILKHVEKEDNHVWFK